MELSAPVFSEALPQRQAERVRLGPTHLLQLPVLGVEADDNHDDWTFAL